MTPKVLICDPIAEAGLDKLNEAGYQLKMGDELSAEGLKREISDYQAIVVRSATKVTQSLIDAAEELQLIVRAGVGLDNIDLDYAEEKGITVQNTPEASSNSVAELALGHMFSLARHIPVGTQSLKENKWLKSQFKGTELDGKTLGIIGVGRIGTLVARKGSALGMDPLGFDKYITEPPIKEIEMVSKEKLLKTSDFVSLHIPYDKQQGAEIGSEEFSLMKPSAYLVNCARGPVVDKGALERALEEEMIAGVALDVYDEEPPGDSPIFRSKNVSLTPHIGASTLEAQTRVGLHAAEKIIDFFGREG